MLRKALRNAKSTTFAVISKIIGDDRGRVTVPCLSGPAHGLKFRLDLRGGFHDGYFWGSYEQDVVDRLPGILRQGMTVWDCGCYIGYYTCLFARLVGPQGRVVAFEPDTRNMSCVKENAGLNGFSNIDFHEMAISAGADKVSFIECDNTNSHVEGAWIGGSEKGYTESVAKNGRRREVAAATLDCLYARGDIPEPDFVKIDIEGFEGAALAQAGELATRRRPLFLVELHNPECDLAVWEFSQRYGYTVQSMQSGSLVESPEDTGGTVLLQAWPGVAASP